MNAKRALWGVLGFWFALALAACGDESLDGDEDTVPQAIDGDIDEVVKGYCDCMFLRCHDFYHEKWGEDELKAREGCLEEGRMVPRSGDLSSERGHNLECRLNQCRVVEKDSPECERAASTLVCR